MTDTDLLRSIKTTVDIIRSEQLEQHHELVQQGAALNRYGHDIRSLKDDVRVLKAARTSAHAIELADFPDSPSGMHKLPTVDELDSLLIAKRDAEAWRALKANLKQVVLPGFTVIVVGIGTWVWFALSHSH